MTWQDTEGPGNLAREERHDAEQGIHSCGSLNHDPHSSIFHIDQTKVMDNTFVRVLSWYDNEWGFSNRMSDTAIAISKTI